MFLGFSPDRFLGSEGNGKTLLLFLWNIPRWERRRGINDFKFINLFFFFGNRFVIFAV